MSVKRFPWAFLALSILSTSSMLHGQLANLTKNDPYPFFTSYYPYDFLSYREKIEVFEKHNEIYEEDRFRISISPFRQWARCANDIFKNNCRIGDLPTGAGMNFVALFYDPYMAQELINLLCLTDVTLTTSSCCPPIPPESPTDAQDIFNLIQNPKRADQFRQLGYVSTPILYRKYGLRFQADLLLIDNCFDALGLTIQLGVADVRQTATAFVDLTCTATTVPCPAHNDSSTSTSACTQTASSGVTPNNCCNEACCIGFDCATKKYIINNIVKQRQKIAHFLGYDLCNTYHDIGLEDARISLFWRHTYDLNPEDSDAWARVLFMPFLQMGVGIPLAKKLDPSRIFAVPVGNNGHTSFGVSGGFTLDFLETVDLAFEAGWTHFFKEDFCNYPLPTSEFESVIFPYRADVQIAPGPTWNFAATLHAYHFLENLTFWVQWLYVSHSEDHIKICRSLIPPASCFNKDRGECALDCHIPSDGYQNGTFGNGFLVDRAESWTKWENQTINVAFTYDIARFVTLGIMWQAPFRRRNSYRTNTVLGSIMMTY